MIELRALGTAEIETSVTTLTPAQGIVFASALYLILERGRRVSRAGLASLLWPRVEEKSRAHRLRQTILQLKKAGIALNADRNNVQLHRPEVNRDIDSLSAVDADQHRTQDSLEFLPGYSPPFSEPFREWVDTKRSDVHAAATRMLVRELERARTRGDWASVEKITADCLALDPYNEVAVLARAEASAMRGAKREAMAILDRYIEEVGKTHADIRMPAVLLRRRVSESGLGGKAATQEDPGFVGRDKEMKVLIDSLELARRGRGAGCHIVGDAGIGKSRLASELAKFAELQGITVQRVRCRRGDASHPLSAIVDLVPRLREMAGSIGCEPETLNALRRLTEFDTRTIEFFSAADDSVSLFTPIRDALLDLLDAVTEDSCVLIIVDDVHWLDRASSRVFARLVEWSSTNRALFVFNSRETPSLLNDPLLSDIEVIRLGRLSDASSGRLLQSLVEIRDRHADPALFQRILSAGEGNPFFLQQLTKQWLETGDGKQVPSSVNAVLSDRLSRLTGEALQTLQVCALLGDNSTLERVENMLEYKAHRLLAAIQELSVAGMLNSIDTPAVGGSQHPRSRHDLLSTAALERLAPLSLALLHRRAGIVLEQELRGERLATSLLWACAFHWHNAGDRDRALSLASSCAEHLLNVGLPQNACEAFERALAYCATDEQRLALLPRLVAALQMTGEWEKSKTILHDCMRLRANMPDANQHDEFEILFFDAYARTSLNVLELIPNIVRCVECKDASAHHRIRAALIALKLASDVDLEIMDSVYSQIQPLFVGSDVDLAARLEIDMVYHSARGDPEIGLDAARKVVQDARSSNDPMALSRGLLNAAYSCRLSGHYGEAEEYLQEALERSLALGHNERASLAMLSIVRLRLLTEDIGLAREMLEKNKRLVISSENMNRRAEQSYTEARVAVEEGKAEEAAAAFARIGEASALSPSRRAAYLALETRIRLLEKAPFLVLQPLISELERVHLQIRKIGLQDFEAYSLFLGLRALGNEARGLALVKEYLKRHRREPASPPRNLLSLVESGQFVSAVGMR